MRTIAVLVAVTSVILSQEPAEKNPPDLQVSIDFPGGSAKVESVDQKSRAIRLVPATHADRGWICWWYCKVQGIQPGETITLDVGGGVWATPDRAMFSLDDKDWQHTAPGQRMKDRIVFKQKIDAKEAWFAWGPPFVLKHANEAVQRATKMSPHATAIELCKSKEGRAVPGLRVSQPGAPDADRLGIWVQARQHAWEAGSSWVCQGFIDWLLSDDARAQQLRKRAAITIIPVMDVDNVERGAGGKNQKPQDHNRDWSDKPHWPEVAAAQKQITDMNAAGRFDLFIDLHNPGAGDRNPYFYISPRKLLSERGGKNLDDFLKSAKDEMTGPLKFEGRTPESGPDYDNNWQQISKNWVTMNTKDHVVGLTLETAWNTPNSTQENYRRVGKELGLAVELYTRGKIRGEK